MDLYTRKGIKSDLHDFNTGVTYSIADGVSCKIKPLSHSFFENEGTDLLQGNMKSAKEVLGLNGNFYYMGATKHRGIDVDIWEKAEKFTTVLGSEEFYYLVVTTVYFTKTMVDDVNKGEDMENVPVYSLVTAYDAPNHVAMKRQLNIFAYDDYVGSDIFKGFPIQDCFPMSLDRANFLLIMKEGPELSDQIQNNNELFIAGIKSEIMRIGNVSALRIPFLKIYYEASQIFVSGLLLDRPPAIKQFELLFKNQAKASTKLEIVPDAINPEQCAYACIGETKFTCGAFHFCGANAPSEGDCFLNKESLIKPTMDHELFDNCYVYARAEMNSNNYEEYLPKVIKKLEQAAADSSFNIRVKLVQDNSEAILKVQNLIIEDGPFDTSYLDKPYNLVYNGFQLKPPSEDEVTVTKDYVDTELDCYRACKNDETIACQSFSYCPNAEAKKCRISENFVYADSSTPKDFLDADNECNTYSLKYLELFDENPGKLLMRPGEASLKNIKSVEECAMKCKTHKTIKCRGFEYCKSEKSCVLHSTHIMDVKPSEVATKVTQCVHYSAKFTADYLNMGHTIIEDLSNRRKGLSVENCAKVCSEDMPDCKAFVFCPEEYVENSLCYLTALSLTSKGVDEKIKESSQCFLYSKRDDIHDWGTKKPVPTLVSKNSLTGLIIGMLIFGLFIGVTAYLGYNYRRSRQAGSDGMTIRFTKQQNE